jgi:hypothetical protein
LFRALDEARDALPAGAALALGQVLPAVAAPLLAAALREGGSSPSQ